MARKKRGPNPLPIKDVEAIESLARILRKCLEIHDRSAPNVLYVFEQLKKIFPRLKLRIVPDSSLKKPARSAPRNWTIRIRQSVYEALLRGQWLARWTLCHEIAHVLRAHPGKPFREEIGEKRRAWKEREANVFTRRFLIPPHLSAKYTKTEEISHVFQVSSEAAKIALFEQRTERLRSNSSSPYIRAAADAIRARLDYTSLIEDQTAAVLYAIFQTIAEANAMSIPAESFRNNPLSTAMLTAVGSRLLHDAYGSFHRSIGANNFQSAAALVAAISYMHPIREIGDPNSRRAEILILNQKCGLHAVMKLLQFDSRTNRVTLPSPDDPIMFESSYLNDLVQIGADRIRDEITILSLNSLPNYQSYNVSNDVAWCDIHYLERLMNALALLVCDSERA